MNKLIAEYFRKENHRLNLELQKALRECISCTERCMESHPPVLRIKLKCLVALQAVFVFLWPLGACIAPFLAAVMLVCHFLYMRSCRQDVEKYRSHLASLEKEIEAESNLPV